jgi:hypothetical protein
LRYVPRGIQAGLVLGPAQQFLIEAVVLGDQKRVVGAQSERLPRRVSENALDAVGGRLSDILKGGSRIVDRDQIVDVVMRIGRPELHALFTHRLLKPQIITDAGLGLQIGVPEEIKGWKVLKQLRQSRRFEAGPDATLEVHTARS